MRKRNGPMFGLPRDDLDEQDIAQKETMSTQMTEILLSRVQRLGGVLAEAKQTLDADVDPGSDHCTARLHKLRTAQARARYGYESRNGTHGEAAGLMGLPRGFPSKVLTAKALFTDRLARKASPADSREENPANTASTADLHGGQNRRGEGKGKDDKKVGGLFTAEENRQRALLERELHGIADRNVTRSVETIAYQYGSAAPFETQSRLMLSYVLTLIALPPHENVRRSLTKAVLSPVVGAIFSCLFWFSLLLNFNKPRIRAAFKHARLRDKRERLLAQENQVDADLSALRRDLSRHYIDLIRAFQDVPPLKRDHVHRYIPFAVAHGILVGFRYLCPGSRHLYTTSLQQQVYESCCNLLLGTPISPISVEQIRVMLFPSESRSLFVQDSNGPAAGGAEEDASPKARIGPASTSQAAADEFAANDKWGLSMFQPRERFDAMHVGGLLQDFLANGNPNQGVRPGTAPAHMVRRTLPSSNSRVGGTNTFRKTPSRSHVVRVIADRCAREREEYRLFVQKSRSSLHASTRAVTTQRDSLLRAGAAKVGRFCLDLAQHDPDLLQEYLTAPPGPTTSVSSSDASASTVVPKKSIKRRNKPKFAEDSISGESKGVRNKHLQGEQKLDFHANLAVHTNLPPAERVIAATEKIEASRKSERQKPRTKARILLCGI